MLVARGSKAFGVIPAIALLLCASLLVALEAPSKPFLDKNSFYLSSAGFRVQVANDAAGKKAMHALPPHRFVVHRTGNDVRYLYAEPNHCVCIFIGTQANYQDYRDILAKPARSARQRRARLQDAGQRVAVRRSLRLEQSQPARQRRGLSAGVLLRGRDVSTRRPRLDAGTHTPRPLDFERSAVDTFALTTAAAYGSRLQAGTTAGGR